MSDDVEERRKQTSTEAVKMLKKVLAGQGKLQGNFYFVANSSAEQGGIAVSLTKKR